MRVGRAAGSLGRPAAAAGPEGPDAGRWALSCPGALAAAALLWSAEVLLLRVTSGPVAPAALLLSAFGLAALHLVAVAAPFRVGAPTLLAAVLAHGTLAALALAVAGPALVASGRSRVMAGAASAALALVIAGGLLGRRGRPWPAPWLVVGALGVAAAGAWRLNDLAPRPGVWLPLGIGWILLALLARRRPGVWLATAGVGMIGLLPGREVMVIWPEGGPPPAGPDVILLTVDTLRADIAEEMAAYQRLAAEGTVFTAAQAEAPWTLPSMATLLTGEPVQAHGAGRVREGKGAISRRVTTLASRLRRVGYDTVGIIGANKWVGSRFGFDRGFSVFHEPLAERPYALPGPWSARPVVAEALSYPWRGREPIADADRLVDRATGILSQRRERPLLLWIHFFDCHLPYRNAEEAALPWRSRLHLDRLTRADLLAEPHWRTADGLTTLVAGYRNEVERVDRAVLRLLDLLGPSTPRGRLVILTADHGEEFLDHGGFEHGHSLYQEVIGIPLVVSGPGFEPGRVVGNAVSMVDVAPTILAAVGLERTNLPGQDLARPVEERPRLSQNLFWSVRPNRQFAVRDGRWKHILGRRGGEVYDLVTDPEEIRNRAAAHEPALEEIRQRFGPLLLRRGVPAPLTGEDTRALQALGYI